MQILERIAGGLVGAMLGGIVGGCYGFVLACLLAPVPDKLAHEWYIMAVYAYVLFSAVGGAVIGMVVGAIGRRHATFGAMIGLVLGTGVGFILWASGPFPPHHSYTGMTIVYSAFLGSLLGAGIGAVMFGSGNDQRIKPFRRLPEETPRYWPTAARSTEITADHSLQHIRDRRSPP